MKPQWGRRAARLILALGVVGGALGAVVAPAPDAAAVTVDPSLGFTLDSYGPAILDASGTLSLALTITNSTAGSVEPLTLTVRLTRTPLRTTEELDAWLAGESSRLTNAVASSPVGQQGVGINAAEPGPLEPGRAVRSMVNVPASELNLPASTWGVYGVRAVLSRDGEEFGAAHGAFTWVAGAITPVPLTAVVPVTGDPLLADAIVTAVAARPATLIINPVTLTALTQTRPDLEESLTGDVYALPWGDPDIGTLAQAGADDLLDAALGYTRSDGGALVASRPWVALASRADHESLDLAGQQGAYAMMVWPADTSGSLGPPDATANGTVVARTDQGPLIIRPHPGLSAQLTDTAVTDQAAMTAFIASSALAAQESGGAPIIVAPGPRWAPTGPDTTLSTLLGLPWFVPTTLEDAVAASARTRLDISEVSSPPLEVPIAAVEAAQGALVRLGVTASAAQDPNAVTKPTTLLVLNALADTGPRTSEDRVLALVAAIDQATVTSGGVSFASLSSLNLISSEGQMPINVTNALPTPVTVRLVLTSSSPNLIIRDTPLVTIPAESTQQVLVPVTGVSNANVTVQMRLVTPGGADITTPATLSVRVRAQWGNAATAVVTAAFVALLVAGIVRTIRRGRKDTRTTVLSPHPAAKDSDD